MENSEKGIWHNLVKNKTDLPEEEGPYVVLVKTIIGKACYNTAQMDYFDSDDKSWMAFNGKEDRIIAWYAVPDFKE